MQPAWKQDSKAANIQPRQVPQFEAAGAQLDGKNYQIALRRTLTQVTLLVLVVGLAGFALMFRGSLTGEKTGFAQFKTQDLKAERDAVRLMVVESKRTNELEGWIFNTKPRTDALTFLTVKVRVRNTARKNYNLDPFGFSVFTSDGDRVNASPKTRHMSGRLTPTVLSPNEEAEGFLVFEIPKRIRPNSIQINGGSGIVAKVNLF
ncbi:DUF4352 domain-containing protein [Acanthopleuribacter pedis]|uniref:DUF4352 domain-containing protein n=1 Tax=Acanthopleuribacter pedis TaxID=442870 RepID=A0A8J7QEU9_9BACT|nr:DUF4352 domain-containing protein [Acanthopleuribacter pedis]MBO1322699.1 DUF4352 domain-containing protein [Acanthopleuribacter pedis]